MLTHDDQWMKEEPAAPSLGISPRSGEKLSAFSAF